MEWWMDHQDHHLACTYLNLGLSGWVVPNFTFNHHKNRTNVAPRVQGELGVSSNMSRNGGKSRQH
jgi:hypothetical protein